MAEEYEYEYIEHILDILAERDLLEQLAEEASELSQAALKLVRAAKLNNNATPRSEANAIENLVAEYNDVLVSWELALKSMRAIKLEAITQTANGERRKKLKRWAERLGYKESKNE